MWKRLHGRRVASIRSFFGMIILILPFLAISGALMEEDGFASSAFKKAVDCFLPEKVLLKTLSGGAVNFAGALAVAIWAMGACLLRHESALKYADL
jgi:hypothetical protein